MRPLRIFLSGIIVLAFVIGVAGCSALRLGYANGDTLVYWWMDRYVGFSSEQTPWVKDEIAKFFDWHRRTELPDYAQVLTRTQQRLERPVSAAEVQDEFALMKGRAERIAEHALPALTRLALSLSPQQINSIERRFASNNEKYRKEYLRGSLQERQQARFEKVMKHAAYWFGDFNKEQKERIRAASDARPMDYEIGMAERRRRQGELIVLLRRIQSERPSQEVASAMLRTYLARLLESVTYAQDKAFFERSREGMAQMTAQIINMTTPRQKEHASRRLQRLIDDGYGLAGVQPPHRLSMQAD